MAVLRMLQQGINLVSDHMSSRIHRRIDEAYSRVHTLQNRVSSLRSAASVASLQLLPTLAVHNGVATCTSGASTESMYAPLHADCQLAFQAPERSHATRCASRQEQPAPNLWGGGQIELACQDAASNRLVASVLLGSGSTWEDVRDGVQRTVLERSGCSVQAMRFGDGAGGTFCLNSDASWVLCKVRRRKS